jgi:hypothetical protein
MTYTGIFLVIIGCHIFFFLEKLPLTGGVRGERERRVDSGRR